MAFDNYVTLIRIMNYKYFIATYLTWMANLTFFFLLLSMACGILIPPPGMEPGPPAFGTQSLNHWTSREVQRITYIHIIIYLISHLKYSSDC